MRLKRRDEERDDQRGDDRSDGKQAAAEVAARVEAVEAALASGSDRLDPDAVEHARSVLGRTSQRLRLGAEYTVVALAGSTGSGKSSLFNAIAGMEITQVGVRRPTTAVPTACVWGEGAQELLDWLEVPRRHRTSRESVLDADRQADLHGLVLLDLPDHDSTAMAHRLEVDRLVGLVDLLVWVVDPQKYADQALHAGYLRRLAGHQDVMLVVLNQVDTLSPGAADHCLTDLRRLLEEDGLPGVTVATVSARRGDGVAQLRATLAQVVSARASVSARAAADLHRAGRLLAEGVADTEPDPTRGDGATTLIAALSDAAGVPTVLDAVQGDYRRQAGASTGWPFTRWLGRLRANPIRRLGLRPEAPDLHALTRSSLPEASSAQRGRVAMATRRLVDCATVGLPPRWADDVRRAANPAGDDFADALDQAVTGTDLDLRRPRWWSVLGFVQVLFALAVVVGAGWLLGLAVLAYLQLPAPTTPGVGGESVPTLPLPTLLLFGGLLAGLLVSLVGRRIARVGARARRNRVARRLRDAITVVADKHVLDPVARVLGEHRSTREALRRFTGPSR